MNEHLKTSLFSFMGGWFMASALLTLHDNQLLNLASLLTGSVCFVYGLWPRKGIK